MKPLLLGTLDQATTVVLPLLGNQIYFGFAGSRENADSLIGDDTVWAPQCGDEPPRQENG